MINKGQKKTKKTKKNNRTFFKLIYRLFDSLMIRSDLPFFGRIANKVRVFFARKISKGIDKHAFIDKGATIDINVNVGKQGCIGKKCLISSSVSIGEDTMMGPEVLFFTMQHKKDINSKKFLEGYENIKPIKVGKNCWIGQRSIILGGVEIGDFVTVGAGSVVTKNVPSNCMVAGNPAVIKKEYKNE